MVWNFRNEKLFTQSFIKFILTIRKFFFYFKENKFLLIVVELVSVFNL